MSGGWLFTLAGKPKRSEAKAAAEYAISLGVPENKIFLEEKSQDTIGNAFFTKINFLEPKKWENIIIVTSEFHIKRTKYLFKKILGPKYKISLIAADSHLTKEQLEEKAKDEVATQDFLKKWLGPIPDGDNDKMRKLIYEEHPAYSDDPKYSTEQLQSMTSRG